MVTMGLVSLIFAGFMLYRRRDIKRMFAYSSIEHMGLITFAFGMGGPLANFAGLLHMTMHSLTKSAIFFAVGHIAQAKGTQRMAEIRGLTESHPVLGWGLVLGVVAIAGLPPLGIFMSEFLIVSSTFARAPLLAILLVFGLLIAFGALMLRLNEIAFGEPDRQHRAGRGLLRAAVCASGPRAGGGHLSAGPAGGLVPGRGAAAGRERSADDGASLLASAGRYAGKWPTQSSGVHRPWPRVRRSDRATAVAAGGPRHCRRRGDAARPVERRGGGAPGACRAEQAPSCWSSACPAPSGASRPSRATHPPALRLERTIRDLYGLEPEGSPDTRRWLDHGRWGVRQPLGDARGGARHRRCLRLPRRRRPAAAPDPGRPGACRHHRARPFPLHLPTARPSCAWRSGWATCTRASTA